MPPRPICSTMRYFPMICPTMCADDTGPSARQQDWKRQLGRASVCYKQYVFLRHQEEFMRGRGLTTAALAFGALLICSGVATAADAPRQVTFSKDVAPIFQAKCQ